MTRLRITVQITESDKEKIENAIKNYYPKYKNISQVVREALREFLEKQLGEAEA
jgi:Arc/MetJ-type ribon-helix-helix transcriptional regulator